MIIHLKKSRLFTIDPSKRFGREFGVNETVWAECWVKHKLYHFTIPELRDYLHFKIGRRPSLRSVERWATRTEIFSIAKKAFKMEATTVQSYFFGEYERMVIDELVKNMRAGVVKKPKSIV